MLDRSQDTLLSQSASQPILGSVWERMAVLKVQLLERISPIIESTRPIWEDPLWQFLGMILAVVITVMIALWLLSCLGGRIAAFVEGIKNIIVSIFSFLLKILPFNKNNDEPSVKQKKSFWFNRLNVKKAFDSVRYLTTRRDWRYQSSWYLMTGTENSGKEDWLNNIEHNRRTHLLFREKQLMVEGSGWHFFDNGLIIDIEDETEFSQAIDLVTTYRPERPLDGVILLVSANSLQEYSDDSGKLRELGQDLYEKMWAIQKITGFVLPVYLVISECELIDGFDTFWSAWNDETPTEMFGWSNPSRIDTAFSIQWVKEAFTSILANIRKAQLHIAANSEKIDDIDRFMLFDQEFQALEKPLTELIAEGFSRSSFQEALPLRGIWFSGKVKDEHALNESLLSDKVWPETHLAYPIEQRFFSANKTLRRFQYMSIAFGMLLLAGLCVDSYRMYNYTSAAQQAWNSTFNRNVKRFYCSNEGMDTWWLLNNITKLSDQPTTLTIPASWWGGQIPALRSALAKEVHPTMLFPAYECRLRIRANQLNALSKEKIDVTADLNQLSAHLSEYAEKLMEYQQAQTRFIELVGPLTRTKGMADKIQRLTDYLYDGTIPSTINFESTLLVGSVMDASYAITWDVNDLINSNEQGQYLLELSQVVRKKIEEEALNPPLEDIIDAFFVSSDSSLSSNSSTSSTRKMLASVDTFQNWLQYMSLQWLGSNANGTPCTHLYKKLDAMRFFLEQAGYPKTLLSNAVDIFNEVNCDIYIRQRLERINEPPFGKLFITNVDNKVDFSSDLLHWVDEFTALESLNLLATGNENTSEYQEKGIQPTGNVIAWDSAPLSEAIDIMLGFQAFRQQWWQTESNTRGEPFYASALRSRLQQKVQQLLIASQVYEYTQKPNKIMASEDAESRLNSSVASFERAEGSLRQLQALLKQEGDTTNAHLLQKQSREFILQQLSKLTFITTSNKLYTPIKRTGWDSDTLAEALFSYADEKSVANYLENQRQRLSYLTKNYAQPLVSYLVDTDVVAESRNNARLWYNTLLELQRYERQQAGNDIEQLEHYVAQKLGSKSWHDCGLLLKEPFVLSSGGVFSQRYYDLNQTVRSKCNSYGKNTVIRQYLALAERFNRDIKGQFPFAKYDAAGNNDIEMSVLKSFMNDYQTVWRKPETGASLLSALTQFLKNNPNTGLDDWLVFVKKIDRFASFYRQVSDKEGNIIIPLAIEFDARSSASQGQDQIIEWRLANGSQTAIFPNGSHRIEWQQGQPLSLVLRWANGSEYYPLAEKGISNHSLPNTFSAGFNTQGQWGIFEWLQQYAERSKTTVNQNWFLFTVPVGLKAALNKDNKEQQSIAYISRIHLAMSAIITGDNGREKRVSIPYQLPIFAPSLPGRDE
jgi:type VI secretion system protein ImpL